MATAEQVAQTIMNKLVREQNYLVMMRPADPPPGRLRRGNVSCLRPCQVRRRDSTGRAACG